MTAIYMYKSVIGIRGGRIFEGYVNFFKCKIRRILNSDEPCMGIVFDPLNVSALPLKSKIV